MGKLKIYKITFCPFNLKGVMLPSRKVYIVAVSKEQAMKYFRDWRIERLRKSYFFEKIEKVNKTSEEGKKAIKQYGNIQNCLSVQDNYIYKGIKPNEEIKTRKSHRT